MNKVEREIARDKKLEEAVKEIKSLSILIKNLSKEIEGLKKKGSK